MNDTKVFYIASVAFLVMAIIYFFAGNYTGAAMWGIILMILSAITMGTHLWGKDD